jgi:hypothetical protein
MIQLYMGICDGIGFWVISVSGTMGIQSGFQLCEFFFDSIELLLTGISWPLEENTNLVVTSTTMMPSVPFFRSMNGSATP